MTSDDLAAQVATFSSRAEAQAAADKALPKRTRHNRPQPCGSGYHSAREGGDRWVVIVSNAILLKDGTMYDHMLGRTIG